MSRPIVRRELFELSPRDSEDAGDPLEVVICGPSDKATAPWADLPVVVFDWRSPEGDDLRVEVPLHYFRRFLEVEV